ncbi:alanine--tRNA ligase [Candidatus Dojkabacteria bacterium]|nr:alanine--tRNA ligase [Candidatus Dojkabacteria bacterium]
MLTSDQIRQKWISYWTSAPRKHKEIPAVSLVPENNPTLLFVNSGMFPLTEYLAGKKHPLGTRLCNIQRSLRTSYDDWMEIGDNRHTLMFEMVGNWSLNDYFKKEQIPWIMDFLVDELGIDPSRLYVSVWGGDDLVPRDDEAVTLWKNVFKKHCITAEFCENKSNLPKDLVAGKTHTARIFPYDRKKNWWQRGEASGELGGSTSEIFYDMGKIEREQDEYHINDDSGRFVEIGNSVFMEYRLDDAMNWTPLGKQNVDFGGGLERICMVVQGKKDIFETDIFRPIIEKLEEVSGKKYKDNEEENANTRYFRILADHGRASVFLIADGVLPSNKDQGYILRRFIRRLVVVGKKLGIDKEFAGKVAEAVIDRMKTPYPFLESQRGHILDVIREEEGKFRRTIDKAVKQLTSWAKEIKGVDNITGEKLFYFKETYGLPVELIIEEVGNHMKFRGVIFMDSDVKKLLSEFKAAELAHREKSRIGASQKFKGGLADASEITTMYHTTTHILLKALQVVLGDHVHQKGSNITAERLRFDFSHPEALTDDQVTRVEELVNKAISGNLKMTKEEMSLTDAREVGAEGVFDDRYGEKVSVYTLLDETTGEVFSKEICGGPHVENTNEIAKQGKFRILKQENIGAGSRRIKAVVN